MGAAPSDEVTSEQLCLEHAIRGPGQFAAIPHSAPAGPTSIEEKLSLAVSGASVFASDATIDGYVHSNRFSREQMQQLGRDLIPHYKARTTLNIGGFQLKPLDGRYLIALFNQPLREAFRAHTPLETSPTASKLFPDAAYHELVVCIPEVQELRAAQSGFAGLNGVEAVILEFMNDSKIYVSIGDTESSAAGSCEECLQQAGLTVTHRTAVFGTVFGHALQYAVEFSKRHSYDFKHWNCKAFAATVLESCQTGAYCEQRDDTHMFKKRLVAAVSRTQ